MTCKNHVLGINLGLLFSRFKIPVVSTCSFYSFQFLNVHKGFLFCCSVAQLCPTLCDPMDCKHARLLCPSPSPGVCSDLSPLSQWCHSTISVLCRPLLLLPFLFTWPNIHSLSFSFFDQTSHSIIHWLTLFKVFNG